MTHFRIIPIALSLTTAIVLTACNTPSTMMPMGTASVSPMTAPDHVGKMDAQMKTMQAMHDKMMAAKTPEERNKLMAEHMKTMQDGMAMMEGMSGMSSMKGMQGMGGMGGMGGEMATRHQTMEKRMEMMQTMMKMMMDRMNAAPMK